MKHAMGNLALQLQEEYSLLLEHHNQLFYLVNEALTVLKQEQGESKEPFNEEALELVDVFQRTHTALSERNSYFFYNRLVSYTNEGRRLLIIGVDSKRSRQEMKDLLQTVLNEVQQQEEPLQNLFQVVSDFQIYLRTVVSVANNYDSAASKLLQTITRCQQVCHTAIPLLHKWFVHFSEPLESPPQL